MKRSRESRIELRNVQILKKMLEKSSKFLPPEQLCEPKRLDVNCFECCRNCKNSLGKLAVAVNTGGHSIRVLNERSASDGGKLCPLWLVILKSVCYSVGDTL